MEIDVDVKVEPSVGTPLVHQLGKLVLGTIAAFAASKGAEKAYDAVLKHRNTNTTIDTE